MAIFPSRETGNISRKRHTPVLFLFGKGHFRRKVASSFQTDRLEKIQILDAGQISFWPDG